MIPPDVGDLAPVGFVVTRDAFGPGKRALVGILVAGNALGLQPEKGGVTAAVAAVVTILATNRRMSAPEGPTRLAMIETLRSAARPANELCVSSEMLDVTSTALLPAILASVETRLLSYPASQVIMASKASVGIESPPSRVALAAIRVAIDVGVVTAELSRGQKLGAGLPRHEHASNRCRYHQASHAHQRCDAPAHSEKIQRYP